MLELINVKLADLKLYTLKIKDGFFTKVSRQEGLKEVEGDLHLDQIDQDSVFSRSLFICNAQEELFVPGAIDVHVHSRDPGYTEKEDWRSLARSAYRGGVVSLVDMPNTNPPTLTQDSVVQKAHLASQTGIPFKLLLGIAESNIAMIPALMKNKNLPLAGLKVYYGHSTGNMMFSDLNALGHAVDRFDHGVLVFHSEDQCSIEDNERKFSPKINQVQQPKDFIIHSKIRDSNSAYVATKKLLEWARIQERSIHIAHVSTPQEMEMINEYRKKGVPVSCEVAFHHLFFSTDDYEKLGANIKVNPPVRSPEEMYKLREYVVQGDIDCMVTDHAPHLTCEKQRSYQEAPSGIPSIELFWPLLYKFYETTPENTLEKLVDMASANPAKLFGFSCKGRIAVGYEANMVWLKKRETVVQASNLSAKCGWSPYEGIKFSRIVQATWLKGRRVFYQKDD